MKRNFRITIDAPSGISDNTLVRHLRNAIEDHTDWDIEVIQISYKEGHHNARKFVNFKEREDG